MKESHTRFVSIYGLIDPRTSEIRYIGKTRKNPRTRLAEHIRVVETDASYLGRWLRKLRRLGYRPTQIVIQEVSELHWREAERYWIQHFRDRGWRLVNTTAGGTGNDTPAGSASRIRHAEYLRLLNADPARRAQISEKLRNYYATHPEARARIGDQHRGKTISPEHRAIVSAANTRRWSEERAKRASSVG